MISKDNNNSTTIFICVLYIYIYNFFLILKNFFFFSFFFTFNIKIYELTTSTFLKINFLLYTWTVSNSKINYFQLILLLYRQDSELQTAIECRIFIAAIKTALRFFLPPPPFPITRKNAACLSHKSRSVVDSWENINSNMKSLQLVLCNILIFSSIT